MSDGITIGELAKRGGVADSTLRYYERMGLLRPEGRTDANYRVYGPESVERLRFIRTAKASGLSLEDIRTLLEFRDGAVAPCAEVKTVIESRLEHVKRQIKDLRTVEQALEKFHTACETASGGQECPVLDEFGHDDA